MLDEGWCLALLKLRNEPLAFVVTSCGPASPDSMAAYDNSVLGRGWRCHYLRVTVLTWDWDVILKTKVSHRINWRLREVDARFGSCISSFGAFKENIGHWHNESFIDGNKILHQPFIIEAQRLFELCLIYQDDSYILDRRKGLLI